MPRHRHKQPRALRPTYILRAAAGTYRRHPGRIAGSALIVFAPVAVADVLAANVLESAHLGGSWPIATTVLGAAIAILSAQVLVIEFYAGLLDRVVGEDQYGHTAYSFGRVLRTLPWWRLFVVSVVIGAVTNLGLALLIVPGVVAFTYLSLAGPVINIERLGVVAGLRRSVSLVHGHFWLTVTCVTLPLAIEELVYELMHRFVWTHSLVGAVVVEEVLAVTVIAFVGLAEVTLAHALIVEDAQGELAGAPKPRLLVPSDGERP